MLWSCSKSIHFKVKIRNQKKVIAKGTRMMVPSLYLNKSSHLDSLTCTRFVLSHQGRCFKVFEKKKGICFSSVVHQEPLSWTRINAHYFASPGLPRRRIQYLLNDNSTTIKLTNMTAQKFDTWNPPSSRSVQLKFKPTWRISPRYLWKKTSWAVKNSTESSLKHFKNYQSLFRRTTLIQEILFDNTAKVKNEDAWHPMWDWRQKQ